MFAEAIYLLVILILLALSGLGAMTNTFLFIAFLLLLPMLPVLMSLKTAPFVPSKKDRVKTMLKLAKIKVGEVVYDLGAGDGRIVDLASKIGADARGYEISFPLVSYFHFKKIFLGNGGKMYWRNIWSQNYSDANVLILFLMPTAMQKFGEKIFPDLKPGTRVVCNAFEIPGIKPRTSENGIFLYIKS